MRQSLLLLPFDGQGNVVSYVSVVESEYGTEICITFPPEELQLTEGSPPEVWK